MKPTAKKAGIGGRKKGFNGKLVDGMGEWETANAAFFGDPAITEGGKIVADYGAACVGVHVDPSPHSDARLISVMDKIHDALHTRRSKVFREMADYIDAFNQARATGQPTSPALMHAANFVGFCRLVPRKAGSTFEEVSRRSPARWAAWQKPSFTPTVNEIHEYLCEMMADAPDYKTAERAARKLGIAPRGKAK